MHMAQAIYVQDGAAVDYTPGADVAIGEVVVQGDLVGVANRAIAADTPGALAVAGVFDFAKATGGGSAIAMGAIVYWDDTANQATTTSTDNKLLGKVVLAAADADATVRVRMSQ
jgi:predicted RecA/RadA family phage recombinase